MEERTGQVKKDRKKPAILNNIGLRIFALLAAALMWLLVTTINDPVITEQFDNVPVKLLNTEIITEADKVYQVLDNTDTIPVVKVTGARSIVDSIDKDNIVATADVRNITELGTVDISLTTNKNSGKLESIKGSIETVRLDIENRRTAIFTLRASATGEPGEGYVTGDVTVEQNQVRISGAESVVSSISSAAVTVDVTGATGTITTNAEVHLYNSDGVEVDSSALTMNISSVRVSAVVLPTKELPVQAAVSGTPASGYVYARSFTANPATVIVAGRSSALAQAESITIPADRFSIEGATGAVTRTVNIRDLLPENTSFADSSYDGEVEVTVNVEPVSYRTVEFALEDVALSGVPEGYRAELITINDNEGHTVTSSQNTLWNLVLSGLASDLEAADLSALAPTLDVGALTADAEDSSNLAGVYTGIVRFTLPEYVDAVNGVSAAVRLTKQTDL